MRCKIICLIMTWSSLVFSHENTVYPLLKNALTGKEQKLEYSIVVHADLNQTKFKFFLNCQKEISNACQYENLNIKASASMEREQHFVGIAQFNQAESSATKKIYDLTLPLPKTGKWIVDFTVQDGEKLVDKRQMPVEIVPEGPNKVEALTYMLPFLLMAIIAIKVFVFKRRRLKV